MHPPGEVEQCCMFLLALLIVHAFRYGLTRGTTLNEILQHAADAPDRSVARLSPTRPILAALQRLGGLDLDYPAGTNQLQNAIKEMGLISNILTPIHMDAIRVGAAQDMAGLGSAEDGGGLVNDEVRRLLGHNQTTFARGVNEAYAGAAGRGFKDDSSKAQAIYLYSIKEIIHRAPWAARSWNSEVQRAPHPPPYPPRREKM